MLEERAIGFAALEAEGTTIPEGVIAAARGGRWRDPRAGVAQRLSPVAAGGLNPSGVLRRALRLHAKH